MRVGVLVSPESRPVFNTLLKEVFESQTKRACDLELWPEQSAPLWVHMETAVCDEGGNQCRAVLLDITERKLAERLRQETEGRIRAIYDHLPNPTFVWQHRATGFVLTAFNDAAHAATNGAMSNLLGRSAAEFPYGIPDLVLDLGRCFEQRVSVRRELDFVSPVSQTRGRLLASYGFVPPDLVLLQTEDVTEQRQNEDQLRAAQRMDAIGRLAGGIAHDFNNLLTVVLGNISLALTESKVAEAAGDVLQDAKLGALRARDLTQKLLTFAKGGDPFRTAVQLSDLAKETIIFALHGSNVSSDMSAPPDLWNVDADRTQIGQVIQNLAINAIQAMPTGGEIRVVLENTVIAEKSIGSLAAGKYVLLTVADTGAGIAPELLSKVFDPYFTTKTLGSGLGLATAYSIVKKHLGHIEVQSSIGVGTTFRVWLPAAKGQSPASTPVPVVPAPASSSPPFSARVLMMDDEAVIRLLCGKAFVRVGLEVTTTANGIEAVREFSLAWERGRPYQLVIFDLTVPGGMGGKDALAEVRKIDPSIRAIASSGYSNDPVMADYRRFGFDAIVPKPYEIEQMIDAVRHVLAKKV